MEEREVGLQSGDLLLRRVLRFLERLALGNKLLVLLLGHGHGIAAGLRRACLGERVEFFAQRLHSVLQFGIFLPYGVDFTPRGQRLHARIFRRRERVRTVFALKRTKGNLARLAQVKVGHRLAVHERAIGRAAVVEPVVIFL
jgi:hypothetical protein